MYALYWFSCTNKFFSPWCVYGDMVNGKVFFYRFRMHSCSTISRALEALPHKTSGDFTVPHPWRSAAAFYAGNNNTINTVRINWLPDIFSTESTRKTEFGNHTLSRNHWFRNRKHKSPEEVLDGSTVAPLTAYKHGLRRVVLHMRYISIAETSISDLKYDTLSIWNSELFDVSSCNTEIEMS